MTYNPSNSLFEGIRSLFPLEICPWDDYYPRMAQTDWLSDRANLFGSKTYFIRQAPFGGSYAVMGGLTAFLRVLNDFRFNGETSKAMLDMGYKEEFINYLEKKHQRIKIDVYAIPECGIFFPNEPAIIMSGTLLDLRFAEGMLLKQVNFPSLSFTKWSRVIQAIGPGACMEFARRRAQDDLRTTIYSYLAGAKFSSNAEIRRGLNISIVGTMGHEFIQSFGDEFQAFDTWLEYNPDRPVLLGDTRNTLTSGLPNAIRAFKKHRDRIIEAKGVPGFRLDSGDLSYLTIECRKLFDETENSAVRIFETNDLDEYKISSIREQIFSHAPKAELDSNSTLEKCVWACGTQPGTCNDQPSIGGVVKLTSIEQDCQIREVIKLAMDNPIKTSIPGNNRSAWVWDKGANTIRCCIIYPHKDNLNKIRRAIHPDDGNKVLDLTNIEVIPRQQFVYSRDEGTMDRYLELTKGTDLGYLRGYHQTELGMLHWTHKRFTNPHLIKVSLSENLFKIRKDMIKEGKLINI